MELYAWIDEVRTAGGACRRHPYRRRAAFRFVTERGVAAFYWIDSPLSYALIGAMERNELLKLARIVYDNL